MYMVEGWLGAAQVLPLAELEYHAPRRMRLSFTPVPPLPRMLIPVLVAASTPSTQMLTRPFLRPGVFRMTWYSMAYQRLRWKAIVLVMLPQSNPTGRPLKNMP